KFYLFFDAWGFKLFSFTKGDTEYGIGWLPLGGYVKISGMIDESMDKEAMKQPPQPWEFRSKPAWQRLIVMVGGVTMNVILGIAIYAFTLLHYEQKYLPGNAVTDGITAYELGEKIGLKTGDKISAINGNPVERFNELLSSKVIFGCTLTVEREGKTIDVIVPDNFYREVSKTGKGYFLGTFRDVFVVGEVVSSSPAEKVGLKREDKLLVVNGEKISSKDVLKEKIGASKGQPVHILIMRGKDTLTVSPVVSDSGLIGISYGPVFGDYEYTPYTLSSAIKFGSSDAIEALVSNAKGLKKIFTGEEKASESLQGPIGIAAIYGSIWDWQRFWVITGLLSMVLAFMNILPIPALDGGHVVFLLIESVTGKKFSDKIMERAQIVGMVILLSLMVFAVGNDIWKHFIR
ncbi:MAG: RIP metalloprotease RseP, partial [Bacteroidia bacterium]|nr:RIP metalloprotease RseP [Bacteroidia bacterium]